MRIENVTGNLYQKEIRKKNNETKMNEHKKIL